MGVGSACALRLFSGQLFGVPRNLLTPGGPSLSRSTGPQNTEKKYMIQLIQVTAKPHPLLAVLAVA